MHNEEKRLKGGSTISYPLLFSRKLRSSTGDRSKESFVIQYSPKKRKRMRETCVVLLTHKLHSSPLDKTSFENKVDIFFPTRPIKVTLTMHKFWKRVARTEGIKQKKIVTPLAVTMHLNQALVNDDSLRLRWISVFFTVSLLQLNVLG